MAKGKGRDDFLGDFFGDRPGGPPKSKSQAGETRDSKFTIVHDKWDDYDYQAVHEEVKSFGVAEKDLRKVAGELAPPAMADEFFSLVKSIPRLRPNREIRPSFQINATVMDEQMKLAAYEALRAHSVGDPIGTALAAVTMEPHLEVLYDKLKEEKKMADELEKAMQDYRDAEAEGKSVDEMIADAQANGSGEGEGGESMEDMQAQKARIAEQMEMLRKQIEDGAQELQEALGDQASNIRQAISAGLKEALDEAEGGEAMGQAWGLEPGGLKRMNPAQRLELARRLKTDKFKRLAELIGPMMRLAWAEQNKKINTVPEEVYDVELGRDLSHMLPIEYLYLNSPELRIDWMRRYSEHSLYQYALRGNEKVAKGGIIFCEDGSGSMSGEPEIWSKAVGLALLHVAKTQKRPFTGIHFGGTGEFKSFEFDTSGKEYKSKTFYRRDTPNEITLEGVDSVMDFAETFFGGGTDFVTPLSRALEQLQAEHDRYGAVKGDIVFVTDGYCGVDDAWLKKFKEEQDRLGFRVFGVVIGGSAAEPLLTICDGRVATVNDLMSGEDVRHLFNSI